MLTGSFFLTGENILPKGITIGISSYFVHRDPNVFPNPEVFDPMRFSPENLVGRNPFAYIPFSAGSLFILKFWNFAYMWKSRKNLISKHTFSGPRNCIGQKFALLEEKIVLSKLFLNYNFQSVEKREDVKMVSEIIIRPYDGINVKVTKRNWLQK